MNGTRGLLIALGLSALGSRLSAQDAQVVFERTGYRLTSLGARVAVSARVLDARRRAVPNAPIAWRIQDSAVAMVNARGEVQSRRVGRTRVWAVSGGDSASALILVDQWAARFAFSPAVLRFDAVGEQKALQVLARDASGNVIAGIRPAAACRSLNDRVAALAPNGQVRARGSGTTYLRCTDRGVADSVRVEVRQRPVRALIADKANFASRLVGDTFQIRMRAFDGTGEEIREARPTWASLEPRVVRVDPLTGWARAIGVGAEPVKIVGQIGDLTDTIAVSVAAGAGMNLAAVTTPVEVAGTPAAAAARATLSMYAPFPAVGDTATMSITARSPEGTQVDVSTVVLRSSDTSVVKLVSGQRVVGRKEGTAYIVGTFSGITDSAHVSVRARGTSTLGEESNPNFVRPVFMHPDSARLRNARQLRAAVDTILSSSTAGRRGSGRIIAMQATAVQASHATQLSTNVVESRSGLLLGGRASLAPHRKLIFSGDFRFGTLAPAKADLGEEMKVTEAEGHLMYAPASWFALRGGFTRRAQSTPIATQRWQFASVSALTRLGFVGDAISTTFGVSLLPYGTFSGIKNVDGSDAKPNATSLAGEAGLEVHTGFLSAALLYYAERFTFPVINNAERVDRFSMLRLRLGFQLGR